MKNRRADISVIFLLAIPVLVAISGLFIKFNILDFSYLLVVVIIFARYYYSVKRHN